VQNRTRYARTAAETDSTWRAFSHIRDWPATLTHDPGSDRLIRAEAESTPLRQEMVKPKIEVPQQKIADPVITFIQTNGKLHP
jgi:hypothetical protein